MDRGGAASASFAAGATGTAAPLPARHARLSPRFTSAELRVLELVRAGMTNLEIAQRCGIALGTAKCYVNRIFRKLGVRNRLEAVARSQEILGCTFGMRELPLLGSRLEPLQRTELAILAFVELGLTNSEIANRLELTLGTVKWYMRQMFGKLHARNRVDLLLRARHIGVSTHLPRDPGRGVAAFGRARAPHGKRPDVSTALTAPARCAESKW